MFAGADKPISFFQSTLLQEERQLYLCQEDKEIYLSIHAPTRGATIVIMRFLSSLYFQSTLLQEERHDSDNDILTLFAFNPRSYKRSDKLR